MSRLQKSPSSQGPSSKGFPSAIASSLRTRRPSAAPHKVSKAPQIGSRPGGLGGDRTKGVSDRIKSRLSVRYADGPSLPSYPAPPVPALPSHPSALASRRATTDETAENVWTVQEDAGGGSDEEGAGMAGRGVGRGDMGLRRDPGQVDLAEIGKEGFDPEAYLKTKLAGASDAEIQAFVAALEKSKEATSEDLQKNVFKNYTEFITISREISTLEASLLELQSLLSDWKAVPESLSGLSSDAADDPALRRSIASSLGSSSNVPASTRRSSIADLQSLYRTQLQALYSQVSGSQKFIPLIPGRHVVAETSAFVELNPATYKVKGGVHLFLLDDLVLVAAVKRRTGAEEMKEKKGGESDGKLLAEKCWMLAEVTVVDVKDSGDLTNAIKIRRGKETLIFRTDKPDSKRSLLLSFRKVAEELASRKRREIEKEQEKRRTLWQVDMAQGGVPPMPNLPSGISSSRMSASNSAVGTPEAGMSRAASADGTRGKDIRYIEEWTDEVTVALALKNWEEAVELIEEGKERLIGFAAADATDPIPAVLLRQRLATQQDLLLGHLSTSLQSPTIRKPALVTLVSFFYRLEQADLARSTFLSARTDILKRRVGQIKWERGETIQYLNELAVVWFMGVSVTAQWYLNAFRENSMASGLVKWSKEQVEAFAVMFKDQIYTPDQDPAVIEEALEIVRSLSKKLLYDIGLDLTFLFRDGLIDRRGSARSSAVPSRNPSPLPPARPPSPPPPSRSAPTIHQDVPEPPSNRSSGGVPPPRPPRRDRKLKEDGTPYSPSIASESPAHPSSARF